MSEIKSETYVLVMDRDRDRAMNALLNALTDEQVFELEQYFSERSIDFAGFVAEVSKKSHDLGWCEDPNCKK